jgi:hypothetical protein
VKAPDLVVSSPVIAVPPPGVPADLVAVVEGVVEPVLPTRKRRPGTPHASPVRPEAGRLTESAVSLGQTWAEERRAELLREGRPAAGGWPGTLREARLRVERLLLGKLSPRHLASVTGDEREAAARAAYASARVEWCRRAEPEAP